MRAIILAALIFSLGLLAFGQEGVAPAQRELKPDSFPIPMPSPVGPFRVYPEYDTAAAFAGGSVRLTIVVRGDAVSHTENLKLVKCEPEEGEASALKIRPENYDDLSEPGFYVTAYPYTVEIRDNAAPRSHRITLGFQYLGGEIITRTFNMKIGTLTKGLLSVVKREEQDEGLPPFYPHRDRPYVITLQNESYEYPLTVKRISVNSIPEGLIDFTPDALAGGPLTLKVREQRAVQLHFSVRMEGDQYLWGYADKPKLQANIIYEDPYGREVSSYTETFPIKLRIPNYVLVIAMMLGVMVGCFIRYYLEYLARRRSIKRGELWKFILYTVLFGMVVAAFALFGQIKVTAFEKFTGSFDKPIAIFFVGLAGAVAGLQLFVSWYNSLRPKAEEK